MFVYDRDKEKIEGFEAYLTAKGVDRETVVYNCKVVKLLSNCVLLYFQEGLETIDTYCFEEFTDKVVLINEQLGGRDGIPKMLTAMLDLTEYLKENKFIKGGKIAYYRRMFSKTSYYLEKYDMMTGRNDTARNFIKEVKAMPLYTDTMRIIENVNVYELDSIDRIDRILGDVPFGKEGMDSATQLARSMLTDLGMMEEIGRGDTWAATKKGRSFARLPVEERYSALIGMMFGRCSWTSAFKILDGEAPERAFSFMEFWSVLVSVFNKTNEVVIEIGALNGKNGEELILELATSSFRLARIETMKHGMALLDLCFIGMGLLEFSTIGPDKVSYKVTEIGKQIFKLLNWQVSWEMRSKLSLISIFMKEKRYDEAEADILEYLTIYGPEISIWCNLGQIMILKKQYRPAYLVLKHAYENSSKRGKTANTVLYYLVMCCRKLKMEDDEDVKNYEKRLQAIEKK